MRKIIILTFFLYSYLNFFAQEKILFIGNSMTYYNNMPTLFQNLANTKGKNVEVQQYAQGGTGFVNHVNDHNIYRLFSSQKWDAIILQPGTGESVGFSSSTKTTINRGRRLMDSIQKYSPCSKIILYEISNGIGSNNNGGGNYENYFASQTKIKDSITAIAHGMKVPFASAGECFKEHYISSKDLLLHSTYNDVHPGLKGSYLVACSIFNTLYQENIAPCNFYGGIDEITAIYLQKISDSVVLKNKPNWLINTYNLHPDFSFLVNGTNIQLQNQSNNYDSISWNINNEYRTNELSPIYNFQSTGDKSITLTTRKNNCSESITKTIPIISLNLDQTKPINYDYYPNPIRDFIHIETKKNAQTKFSIIDLSGKIIISEENLVKNHIDTSFLNSGIYILILNQENTISKIKLIKN
ncbi:T9SS type A sorting domain-containing protein [Flavobacterium covae]|uniref:SGNH/GDSL hydrolase family protein n=1 Tax=Flavobacterium covae TaxID=2906076 RepID=UPI001FB6E330|nr:SGNH/GDSL hydrolase family protein [Flavobacterium covae]MCJ1805541.1 T9SS type A sorting domain-containing protein [Flavobacterium covae]